MGSKRNRYISGLFAAGALVLIGAALVINRSGTASTGNPYGLNISGVIQSGGSALPTPVAPPPQKPGGVNAPYVNVKATSTATTTQVTQPAQDSSFFDWNSFVAALSHPPKASAATSSDTGISEAYSFIPTGLFSPPSPQTSMDMTDSQKALHGWGQSAGEIILAFESSHTNQPATLTDFIQDRQNASKIASMKQLGADLTSVGDSIAAIDPLPPQMQTAGPGLADAYREIGRNLAAIPDAKGDDATVKAILTYDKSAEAFIQKYVNVVNILATNGIKYTQDEPGGVFMFPSQ